MVEHISSVSNILIVIDKKIADWSVLREAVPASSDVVFIERGENGVDVITAALAQRNSLDAIHIFSHGQSGAVQLGESWLNSDSLSNDPALAQALANAVKDDGDILLYGCEVAQGAKGMAFVRQLAHLTGAGVAASVDLTGNEEFGGNWSLEVQVGTTNYTASLPAVVFAEFQGTLAPPTDENYDDDLGYSSGSVSTFDRSGIRYTITGTNEPYLNGVSNDGPLTGPEDYALWFDAEGKKLISSIKIEAVDPSAFRLMGLSMHFSAGTDALITPDGNAGGAVSYASNSFYQTAENIDLSGNSDFYNITSFTISGDNLGLILDDLNFDDPFVPSTAPTLSATPTDPTFTENGTAVALFSGAAADTNDVGQTFTGLSLTVTNVSNGADELLSIDGATIALTHGNTGALVGNGNYSVGVSGTTATVTLTGIVRSNAQMNTLIEGITYRNTSESPGETGRVITITQTADDGGSNNTVALSESSTVLVAAENDAPTATNLTQTQSFSEDPGAMALNDIVVTDVDAGDNITATLTLSNPAAGSLSSGKFGSATSNYNADTGVWMVTGSVADVNAALAAVALTPAADWDQNFSIATRIRDADGGGPTDGAITVNVTAVNDAPLVSTTGTAATFTENSSATVVDASLTVADVDSNTLTSAEVTISANYQSGEDVLAFSNDGSTQGNIVGSFEAGTLTLTSNGGTATVAEFQSALRSVTYLNSSERPVTAQRTISFKVSDATEVSTTATRLLDIASVNDAPGSNPADGYINTGVSLINGDIAEITDAMLHEGDVDDDGLDVTYTLDSAPVNGTLFVDANNNNLVDAGEALVVEHSFTQADIDLSRLHYVHDGSATTSDSFVFSVRDDDGATLLGQSFSITLSERPVIAVGAGTPAYTEDNAAVTIAPALVVTDGDSVNDMTGATIIVTDRVSGDHLGFADQNGIAGTYDAGTGTLTLTGTASVANYQAALRSVTFSSDSNNPATGAAERTIEFRVQDGSGLHSVSGTSTTVLVTNQNDAPVLDATESPTLNVVAEDTGAPVNGSTTGSSLVSSLLAGATDVDTGALQGMAITQTNHVEGMLWYSTDAGTSWQQVGAVSASSALLLTPDSRLYWQPEANKNGTVSDVLRFLAWDRSAGVAGGTVDASTNGGATAFSAASDSVAITVTAVNDAPAGEVTLTGSAQVGSILTAVTDTLTDVDGLGTFAYVWKTDDKIIADETTDKLTLTNDMLGGKVTVTVQYTDKGNTPEAVTSDATAAVQNPPPPTPAGETVDGAEVTESSGTAPDGTSVNVTDIGIVTENRDEATGDAELANVPLVTNGDTRVLEVGLPTGVGMRVESGSAGNAGGASGLLAAIRSRTNTPEQQGDRDEMTGAGGGFLQDLPDPDNLVVRTLVPTVPANTTTGPANPILVSAAPAQPGTPSVALVIDTRSLPSGTVIQLENVQFAAVVGDVRMTGGSGSQVVSGDSGNQIIVLGEDDDVLRGGAGDDLVGSRDGADRLYGDSGNDWLVGGAGNDTLEGGTDNDVLQGGASDAGQWQFRLVDGELVSEFTASEAIAADAATVTHVGPWWADGVAARDSDGRLAFSYAASDRLELVATLYKAATGDRAQLMDFNAFVNSELTAEELAQEAVTFFFDSQGPLPQALEVQVSLLIEAVWGKGSASESLISEGVNFLNAGGSWGSAMLLLAKAQEAEQLLSNAAGDLILVSDYQTSEAGWSAGSGNDILRGGAGNDRLVGGDGNDLLDGGDGTDVAVFTGGLQDFWLQRQLREDGGEQLVLTRKLSGETDTLIDIELLKVGGHYFGAAGTLPGIDLGTQVDLGDHVIQLTAQQVQAMDLAGIY